MMSDKNYFRKVPWPPIMLLCFLIMMPMAGVHAESLPSLTAYGVKESSLMFPEQVQGTVSAVLGGGQFVMHEKIHLICRETEINGQPAPVAKYSLVSGTKVSIIRYRLKNKKYFVSSMTISSKSSGLSGK